MCKQISMKQPQKNNIQSHSHILIFWLNWFEFLGNTIDSNQSAWMERHSSTRLEENMETNMAWNSGENLTVSCCHKYNIQIYLVGLQSLFEWTREIWKHFAIDVS